MFLRNELRHQNGIVSFIGGALSCALLAVSSFGFAGNNVMNACPSAFGIGRASRTTLKRSSLGNAAPILVDRHFPSLSLRLITASYRIMLLLSLALAFLVWLLSSTSNLPD